MTIIACDGKHIAADGQWNNRQHRDAHTAKKLVVEQGHIFGICGTEILDVLIEWYFDGHNPKNLPHLGQNEAWELIVITPDNNFLLCNVDIPYPRKYQPPFASGSGTAFAMGAMLAGASARRAVEIACQLDLYCGPPITVIDLETRKEVPA